MQSILIEPETQYGRAISAESLGSAEFRADYGIRYAYLAGAMYKGIASVEMVVALGRAGLMGFFGAGGLTHEQLENAIVRIEAGLRPGQAFGMNMLCNYDKPEAEHRVVDLYFKHGVERIEAAAFMQITPSLVRYRLHGLRRNPRTGVEAPRHIVAKVSRPEVAAAFMRPAPAEIVGSLVEAGMLTPGEAELAGSIPIADDICVEADSGGHTDGGVAYALMPSILRLRDGMMAQFGYSKRIRVGAAGGIGSPSAAAAAFILGADFVLTGSINQCTVESGASDAVKDLLESIDVQDTAYAPAGDLFEIGSQIQVLKRGVLFAARANKLFELYQRHNSLDQIEPGVARQIQEKYFKRSFDDVWTETAGYYRRKDPRRLSEMEKSAKKKMAAVFKWYFMHSTLLALEGNPEQIANYQVHCGPALGAFNQWVKGTALEHWRNRNVADVAGFMVEGAADWLNASFQAMAGRAMRATA